MAVYSREQRDFLLRKFAREAGCLPLYGGWKGPGHYRLNRLYDEMDLVWVRPLGAAKVVQLELGL